MLIEHPMKRGYDDEWCVVKVWGVTMTNQKAEGWRILHEELHNLYAPSNYIRVIKSRNMRWVGHVTRVEEMGNAYRIWFGELYGKRPFGRSRRR
jgi:hypothetical protein